MPYGITLPVSYAAQWRGYPRSPFPGIMAAPSTALAFPAVIGKRRAMIIGPERAVPTVPEPDEPPPGVAPPPAAVARVKKPEEAAPPPAVARPKRVKKPPGG